MQKVSIIMPSYNSEVTIRESVESVILQSYQYWELIIIDDCSSDNSPQIIERLVQQDSRIKYFKLEKNSGPAIARNFGINKAEGKFIAFLDSDDLWYSEKLEKQILFMKQNSHVFTYTSYERFIEKNLVIKQLIADSFVCYKRLLKTNCIGCLTVMYDAEKIGKQYFPIIGKHEDYVCWLNILKKVETAYGLPEVLAKYRVGSNSFSSNKLKVATYQWMIYREYEKLPFFASLYYFIHYAIHGVLKHK